MSASDVVFIRAPRACIVAQPAFSEPEALRANRHGSSSDAEQLAEYAGRLRHMGHDNPSQRATRDYLVQFRDPQRVGAFEHAHFSVFVEGISRTLSHDLCFSHSGVAVSERSPRHVDDADLAFIIPPALLGDEVLEAAWCAHMQSAAANYRALFDSLLTRHAWVHDKNHRRRLARDGAFSVLPSAVSTQLIITANARAWRALMESLGHEHADLESRRLAIVLHALLHAAAPSFFEDLEVYTANDRHEAVRLRSA